MTAKGSTGMEVLLSTLEVSHWQTLLCLLMPTISGEKKVYEICNFYPRCKASE